MTGNGTLIDIAVDPSDSRKIMAVYSNYGVNSVWYTSDASLASPTWTNVEGNISALSFRSAVILYDGSAKSYLVGTSKGMYSTNTLNGSSTVWAQEASSSIGYLPVVDIAYRTSDQTLLAGTHGNGMFLAMSVPLPLNFIAFEARLNAPDAVTLNWVVTNAQDVEQYIIQRSTDGLHWENGAAVASRANSGIDLYSGMDYPKSPAGNLYYRIRAVAYSGNAYYSSVARVSFPGGNIAANGIYPTLVNPNLNIEAEGSNCMAVLTDMQGRRVLSLPLKSGKNTADLTQLPAGHYIVRVYQGQQLLRSARIVKQ
jgi:hypothetical protein